MKPGHLFMKGKKQDVETGQYLKILKAFILKIPLPSPWLLPLNLCLLKVVATFVCVRVFVVICC